MLQYICTINFTLIDIIYCIIKGKFVEKRKLRQKIKLYIKKLKNNEIGYDDIPSELHLHPEIVKTERNLGIRKTYKRGYDIILKKFYVEEIILVNNEIRERKIETSFKNFSLYYNFLEGDIYENACYYNYSFSQEEIERYQIDLSQIMFIPYSKVNIDNYTLEPSVEEVEKFNIIEKEYTKLPLNAQDLVYVIIKEYDRKEERFVVRQTWTDKNNNVIKNYVHKFIHFPEFVAFLKGDLSESNLLFCDGLNNLLNADGIILDGAKLTSSVMDKLDIPYENYSFELINVEPDKIILENEKQTMLMLQEHQNNNARDLDWRKKNIHYVSDLHLVHRIRKAGCKSLNDIEYTIQKIIDGLLATSGGTILIGGDVSSDYAIYELFVHLLKKSRYYKNIIFVLGNHELWDFSGENFESISKKYRKLLEENEMILLQNDLIYCDDNGMHKILESQLEEMSEEEIKGLLRTARYVIIGGLAFSGYNNKFNANNGIYRQTIDRETEITESKKFEKLYNNLIPVLLGRDTIIFTHTPKKDWSASEDYQEKFIYVSGHTHINYFHDDGVCRIYSDNQIGYNNENPTLKYFSLDDEYDWFLEYKDGIHEITRDDYISFYRGKNITMQFNHQINILYMLKKSGYYCFIHQAKNKKLSILNGGKAKHLDRRDIEYYYAHMDEQIALIEEPLQKYTLLQKQIADKIKKLGGNGYIHGAIIDIDFYNHVYVNPIDLKVTGYWAEDIIDKVVYPTIPALLKDKCPELHNNYQKLLKENSNYELVIGENKESQLTVRPQKYLETDIYNASREIKKMQKLEKNILTFWYESDNETLSIETNK